MLWWAIICLSAAFVYFQYRIVRKAWVIAKDMQSDRRYFNLINDIEEDF